MSVSGSSRSYYYFEILTRNPFICTMNYPKFIVSYHTEEPNILQSVQSVNLSTLKLFFSRCAIPGLDNDTFEIQNSQHEILVRKFIPESSNEQHEYDTCHVFTGNNSYGNDSRPISASKIACSQWVYDETNFKSTFVTQVCAFILFLSLSSGMIPFTVVSTKSDSDVILCLKLLKKN